ncbi:MAG: hypothetical protein WBQ23_07735 [Bacteroidota bacterium]
MKRAFLLYILLILAFVSGSILAQSSSQYTPLPLLREVDVAGFCDPLLQAKKYYPAIAGDTLGRGAVAWLDERDGLRDVYIRFYDGGTFTTRDMKANDQPQGAVEAAPALACNSSGEGVIVWLEFTNRIRIRRFSTDGALLPIEGSYIENSRATFIGSPSVAVAPDGGFLVSWEEFVQSDGYAVRARLFHADATPASEALVVSTFTPRLVFFGYDSGYWSRNDNIRHAAVDSLGRFCVIWSDFLGYNVSRVMASVIDGRDASVSTAFKLSGEEEENWMFRRNPTVLSTGGPAFFSAWQEDIHGFVFGRMVWCRFAGDRSVFVRDSVPEREIWGAIAILRNGRVLVPQGRLLVLEQDGSYRDGQEWIYSHLPEPFAEYVAGPDVMAEGLPGTLTAVMHLSISKHGGPGHWTRQLALQQLDTAMTRLTPLTLCSTEQCSKDELRPLVARNDRDDILVTYEHSGSVAPTIGATTCDLSGTPSGRQSSMLPRKLPKGDSQPVKLFGAVPLPGQGGSFVVLRVELSVLRSNSPSLATLGRDGSNMLGPVAIDNDASVLEASMTIDADGNILVFYLTTDGKLHRCLFSETLERLEENQTIYSFTAPAPEHLNRIAISMHPDAGAVVSIFSGPHPDYYYPLPADTLVTIVFDRNGVVLDESLRQINAVPQHGRQLRNAIAADGTIAVLWNELLSTGRHLLRIERHDKGSAVARDSSAYDLAQMWPMFTTLQWTGRSELLATWAQNNYFKGVIIDDAYQREWLMLLHGATLREGEFFNDHLAHDVLVIDSTLYLFHESNERPGEGYNVRLRMLRLPSRAVELPETFTFDVTPMPSAGAATLRFTLGEDTPVRATLHDLLGREVRAVDFGMLAPGLRRITFPTAGLASGVYICTVQAGDSAVRPFVIVR